MQQEAVRGSARHAPGKAWRFSAPIPGLAWGPCPHMGTLAPGRRTRCSRVHRRGVSTSRPSGPASATRPPSHCTSTPCASRPAWAWCGPGRGLGSRVDSSAPFSGPCPGSSPLSLRPGGASPSLSLSPTGQAGLHSSRPTFVPILPSSAGRHRGRKVCAPPLSTAGRQIHPPAPAHVPPPPGSLPDSHPQQARALCLTPRPQPCYTHLRHTDVFWASPTSRACGQAGWVGRGREVQAKAPEWTQDSGRDTTLHVPSLSVCSSDTQCQASPRPCPLWPTATWQRSSPPQGKRGGLRGRSQDPPAAGGIRQLQEGGWGKGSPESPQDAVTPLEPCPHEATEGLLGLGPRGWGGAPARLAPTWPGSEPG